MTTYECCSKCGFNECTCVSAILDKPGELIRGKIEIKEYNIGWKCPNCFRIYSPIIKECKICNDRIPRIEKDDLRDIKE